MNLSCLNVGTALRWICAGAMVFAASGFCRMGFADDPRPSTYAPQADLLGQVDFFIGRIEESLADPADYDLAKQSRTLKDANTLAVLGLVLGLHDAEFAEKGAMPDLVKAAQSLAANEKDAAQARESLQAIKAARAGTASHGGELRWEKVAALPLLMKQVPLIHATLKRGITPARLKRMADQSAGQAAALAAIAQASMHDDEYASEGADLDAWKTYCAQMRDAAGEVNAAVRAGDQSRVDGAMQRMLESCEACHAKFR